MLLSTAKSVRRDQVKSPLLRLPGEIRNTIYGYVLGYGGFIIKSKARKTRKTDSDCVKTLCGYGKHGKTYSKGHALALVSVCRQIYVETTMLPYRLNIFTFSIFNEFHDWCGNMIPAHRNAIEAVRIHGATFFCSWLLESHRTQTVEKPPKMRDFKKLRKFPSLKRLYIGKSPFDYRSSYDEMVKRIRKKARNDNLQVIFEA